MTTFDDTLTDGVALAEAMPIGGAYTLNDAFSTLVLIDVTKATPVVLTDGAGFAETVVLNYGILLFDGVGVGSTLAVNQVGHLSLADTLALEEALATGTLVILADTLTVGDALAQQLVVALADTLGITDALAGAATYHWSFSDAVGLAENLALFVGVAVSDTLALAEELVSLRTTSGTLEDGIELAETLTPLLLLNVTLADGVDITDTEAVQALYTGVLQDGIELSAAYLAPDGSFTAWALNTRTAAVTEYQDFVFNSFARIGNRYVGASETGLYWLDGDTDDGDDIVARMRGGFLQFGGTHLSRLKAAYVATRNDAEFVLRIETGDGGVYNYEVSTRSMRSTKVHMGKGQRARYFTFELISTGADFDLDTLEFVPIVVQRRV